MGAENDDSPWLNRVSIQIVLRLVLSNRSQFHPQRYHHEVQQLFRTFALS